MKKQRTRAAIQGHAVRLFAEQGYDATTVDQIAAAAEVSPSTFFRYFPSKEDVVIADEYDDVLLEAVRSAPGELSPVAAVRATFAAGIAAMSADDLRRAQQRLQLTMSVPALRARSLENYFVTVRIFREGIAARVDREPDDFAVRVLAGAIVGVLVSTLEIWATEATANFGDLMDRALAELEAGLRLT